MLKTKLIQNLKIGQEFINPKSGVSVINTISSEYIGYIRGNSTIHFPLEYVDKIYSSYKGNKITTKEIREKYPRVFDSKNGGHSCNATFLFMMYEYLDLTKNGIEGRGVSNHPYYVELVDKEL